MIIENSVNSNRIYAPYNKALSQLGKSAQRLATGNRFANASDGTGELGVAQRFRQNRVGASALLETMENATGYSSTQDEILSHVADIITRMSELAASAVDATKITADRTALNIEFRALDTEVAGLAANSKYNGTALFGLTTTIRVGVESTDTVQFSSVNLAALTFATMSLTTVTVASAALNTLKTRAASLAVLRNRARAHNARVERSLSITQAYVANLANSESKIRDTDVATETSNFTAKQVLVSATQSILAQMNNLAQGDLKFFQ